MAKKSNKTSHVLNLITNGNTPEPEEDSSAAAPAAAQPPTGGKADSGQTAAAPAPAAAVSGQEVAAGAASEQPAAAAAVTGQAVPEVTISAQTVPAEAVTGAGAVTGQSVPAAAVTGQSVPAPTVSAQPIPAPAAPVQQVPVQAATPPPADTGTKQPQSDGKTVIVVNETSQNDKISNEIKNRLTDQLEKEIQAKENYRMVNVMEQILSRNDLKKYMKEYGVCSCSRCKADVMALILTRLPAKYVVVDGSSVAPIISFYENKFKIRILTEIIKSCTDVKENPRHGRIQSIY